MPDKLNKSVYLYQTSISEVRQIIKDMKNKSSFGYDLLSPQLIKCVIDEISPLITKLINKSLSMKLYPECLKISKIKPVYKSGPREDIGNYRPISLLPTYNKIFEKVLLKRLVEFIDSNDILYCKQYGFRKYHSTIDALIATYDHIVTNMIKNKKILGVFVDLKKAFDSIDLTILLNKLPFYGISGPFRDLLKSYLSNRKMFTEIGNYKSDLNYVNYGVPQGSILGPLLYLLYINDIKTLTKEIDIRLFADDSSAFCTENNYENLEKKANEMLVLYNNWLMCNKLTLNSTKTHYMIFSKRPKSVPKLKIVFGESYISKESKTKYLGVILQEDLKWNIHITNILGKINRFVPFIYKIKNFISKPVARCL